MGYECLLTGLPELQAGGEAPLTDEALLELLDGTLRASDKEQLNLLRLSQNDECISLLLEQYDDTIVGQPAWWEDARKALSEQDIRMQLLYEYGKQHGNKFVKSWYQYNQDVNNILVAAICRKHGFDVSKSIVGDNDVAQILRRNIQQKDFGLAGVTDYLGDVMALAETDNLFEREKRQDAIRFAWLDEQTRFIHFSIENVLAYYLQNKMLLRWAVLNAEEGERVFRDMVADMKKGVKQ